MASGKCCPGLIPGRGDPDVIFTNHTVSESEQLLLHCVQYSSSILLLSISLTHQHVNTPLLSNLDAWGEPCGGACSPHMPEVSRHYRVMVKAFASGQCGPGSFPGRSRSWSDPNNPPKCQDKKIAISGNFLAILNFACPARSRPLAGNKTAIDGHNFR